MAELEAAHRVLQKRTEVLVSLQTMSRDLISSIDLTELADKICKHACELRKKIIQLELAQTELIKKERLEHELDLARNVQQSVIPKTFLLIPGFEFSGLYRPARRVGGDFYDVIQLDNEHFGILMADVSAKGMPAALYMALTRSLILAEGHRSFSPRIVLENVNRLLKESGDAKMFISVFYGVVHVPTRRMLFSRAGHEYPVLLRSTPIELVGGKGCVLGIQDGEEFILPEESIDLDPGDRLVLFTDGMIDVQNSDNLFQERLNFKRMLLKFSDLSAKQFPQRIFEQLSLYQGEAEQFDDMAILVMDVTQSKEQ